MKRKTQIPVIAFMLMACAVAVVCGLAYAEYNTRQICFGYDAPVILITDNHIVTVDALGLKKEYDISGLYDFWTGLRRIISEYARPAYANYL